METLPDDSNDIQSTWHKVSRDMQKIGYRDGVSDGRDSTFQTNFNDGFVEGFKNGFLIGQQNGTILASFSQHKHPTSGSELLKNSTRGWCQLCLEQDIFNMDRNQIIANQRDVMEKNLNELNSTFFQCSIRDPNNSNQN